MPTTDALAVFDHEVFPGPYDTANDVQMAESAYRWRMRAEKNSALELLPHVSGGRILVAKTAHENRRFAVVCIKDSGERIVAPTTFTTHNQARNAIRAYLSHRLPAEDNQP